VLIAFTDLEGNARAIARFEPGCLVQHRLYGYRGVIVSLDPHCMAGETWYNSNKTQPAKNQPWYHVLVHNSGGLSTYVAQSNLEPDQSGVPISHPRLGCYFAGFKDGRYILNDHHSGGCSI
jgi:heat shock protein HspQ